MFEEQQKTFDFLLPSPSSWMFVCVCVFYNPFRAQKRGLMLKCVCDVMCLSFHFVRSLSLMFRLLRYTSICAEDNRATNFKRIASMPLWTTFESDELKLQARKYTRTHQSIQLYFFNFLFFHFLGRCFSSESMIMVIIVLWCNPSLFGVWRWTRW